MRFWSTFDADGVRTSSWSEDIYPVRESGAPHPAIPPEAVEITEEQWNAIVGSPGTKRWNGSAVINYTPPEPGPAIPASVSDRQFFQALAIRGEITEDEALDAVGPGIIPAAMLALIDQLPEAERFGAKMLIRGATVFERANPLADLIGSLFGWAAEALDEFWTFAATL